MRKLIVALFLMGLLALATAVPLFASIDGPPPGVHGCEISSGHRPGSLGEATATPSETPDLKCFGHP